MRDPIQRPCAIGRTHPSTTSFPKSVVVLVVVLDAPSASSLLVRYYQGSAALSTARAPCPRLLAIAMDIKRLLWESKLAIALVLLIAARCVDRVLYTCVCLSVCCAAAVRLWSTH
jgi:hypothetical protein